jgi:hypothetical protein
MTPRKFYEIFHRIWSEERNKIYGAGSSDGWGETFDMGNYFVRMQRDLEGFFTFWVKVTDLAGRSIEVEMQWLEESDGTDNDEDDEDHDDEDADPDPIAHKWVGEPPTYDDFARLKIFL